MADLADTEGLSVVLSPVQLAAVLQGATVTTPEHRANRLWGVVTLVGGGIELIGSAALLLTPEPTMLTKVGGVALGIHGSDTAATGMRQIWTGEREVTMTQAAATAAARNLGASEETAGRIGVAVDILVPLVVAAGIGAARALAVRSGRISLAAEEAAGGHTIARHIGKTEAELRARLVAQPGIPAASTFRTLAAAEQAVSEGLRANASAIQTWAQGAAVNGTRAFTYAAGRPIGAGVVRSSGMMQPMSSLRIVLRKTAVAQKVYFVLTAFPVP